MLALAVATSGAVDVESNATGMLLLETANIGPSRRLVSHIIGGTITRLRFCTSRPPALWLMILFAWSGRIVLIGIGHETASFLFARHPSEAGSGNQPVRSLRVHPDMVTRPGALGRYAPTRRRCDQQQCTACHIVRLWQWHSRNRCTAATIMATAQQRACRQPHEVGSGCVAFGKNNCSPLIR